MVSLAVSVPRPARREYGSWRLVAALLLLFLTATTSLTGVFTGTGWWLLMAFVGALVLVSGGVLRSIGVPRHISPALSALVLLGALTALFGGGAGLLLVIPTPRSVGHMLQTAGGIRTVINEQAVPAQPVEQLLLLLAVGAGLVALAFDITAVALRMPALTGIPVLMTFSVPIIFLDDGINPLILALCIAAYAWLLRADVRARRGGGAAPLPALAVAASVTVVALVAALTAPGFMPGGAFAFSPTGVNVGAGVNPLVDIGRDLHRPSSVPVLQYTTTAATRPYLKLTTLDTFTGTRWTHTGGTERPVPDDNSIGPAPGLSPGIPTQEVRTSITVGALQSRWLPVPYPVIGVHGQTGDWKWQNDDLTVSSLLSNAEYERYTAVSLSVHPTEQQLRQADAGLGLSKRADLVLPPHVPAIITTSARRATAGDTTEYEKAVDLQNYFRAQGFRYSLQTPLEQGYDGDGLQVIATFLQKKAGYCVHFASAMAIMARSLGIPARVAIGYLPGTNTGVVASGDLEYTVTSSELHSWPELYFAGVGWLAFEPTVGRGSVPSYAIPQGALTPPVEALPTVPRSLVPAPLPPQTADPAQHAATVAASRSAGTTAGAVSLVLLLLVLLFVPATARHLVRRRRRARIRGGRSPAAAAWREITDTARDLGVPVDATETARTLGARLAALLGGEASRTPLTRIRSALERESYGRVGTPEAEAAAPAAGARDAALGTDLAAVLGALRRCRGGGRRVAAFLAPASLLPAGAEWVRGRRRRRGGGGGQPAPSGGRVG